MPFKGGPALSTLACFYRRGQGARCAPGPGTLLPLTLARGAPHMARRAVARSKYPRIFAARRGRACAAPPGRRGVFAVLTATLDTATPRALPKLALPHGARHRCRRCRGASPLSNTQTQVGCALRCVVDVQGAARQRCTRVLHPAPPRRRSCQRAALAGTPTTATCVAHIGPASWGCRGPLHQLSIHPNKRTQVGCAACALTLCWARARRRRTRAAP